METSVINLSNIGQKSSVLQNSAGLSLTHKVMEI